MTSPASAHAMSCADAKLAGGLASISRRARLAVAPHSRLCTRVNVRGIWTAAPTSSVQLQAIGREGCAGHAPAAQQAAHGLPGLQGQKLHRAAPQQGHQRLVGPCWRHRVPARAFWSGACLLPPVQQRALDNVGNASDAGTWACAAAAILGQDRGQPKAKQCCR